MAGMFKGCTSLTSMPLDNVWIPTRKNIEAYADRWVNENFGFGSYNTGYVEVRAPWVEGLSFKQTASANFRTNKSGNFTGVDPENANFGYPIPLNVTFGLNVSF